MSELNILAENASKVSALTAEQKKKLVDETVSQWKGFTHQIQPMLEQSKEAWQLYLDNRPHHSAKRGKKDTSIRIGHIARAVDAVHSFQHNTTFPSDERFFKGTALNDTARSYLDLYESWAALNMAEAGVMEAFFNHRKRMFIDGTACLSVGYKRKVRPKYEYEFPKITVPALMGNSIDIPLSFMKPELVEKPNAISWEGTFAESLEFSDWRIDPTIGSLENSPFLRRWYEPVWKIKKDYSEAENLKPYHHFVEENKNSLNDLGIQPQISIGQAEIEGKEQALLMVRYDNFIVDDNVYENHVALVLNDSELLWFGPNPYHHGEKPYIVTPYNPVPGTLYGKSQIKDAIPSAHAVDKAVNQILEIMDWAANPVFLKNLQDDAVKAQGDIVIQPGLHIPVTRSDAYQQLPININNIGILIELMQILESNIRESTGASPMFTGQDFDAGSGVTAFQVSAHLQGSNNRFQALMFFFNNSTLEPFMRMKWANDRQFMSLEHSVAGFEQKLSPNILKQMDISWNITANLATLHRNQELTNMKALIDMMPTLITNGLVTLKNDQLELDHTVFLKRFFVKAGLPDIDEFLKVFSPNGVV